MTIWLTLGASTLWLGLAAAPAVAQLPAPSGGANQGAAMATQDKTAAVTFQGLQVKAQRLIVDPSVNGFRLILSLTDTDNKTSRLAALMGPVPTLLDDLGNLYQVTNVTGGLRTCSWRSKATDCLRYEADTFVELPKGPDINFMLTFAPVEGKVLEDLRAMATTASLTARIAVVPMGETFRATVAADVVINDLELPK